MAQAPLPPVPTVPAETPADPVVPPPQVQLTDFARRGFHLDVTLRPEQVVEAARLMDAAGFTLELVTGVDWPDRQEMEVVYDYFLFSALCRIAVRTRVLRAEPELPSLRDVYPGADWHERETHEFFGIRFRGHPNLTPLLLPEDATYHPLRKDFTGA